MIYFCPTRLLVAIFICAFRFTALARVVDLTQPKLDTNSHDLGSDVASFILSSSQSVPAVTSNNDPQRITIEKRAVGDVVTWDDALKTGNKILQQHRHYLESGSPGYTMLPDSSQKPEDVLKNKYVTIQGGEFDLTERIYHSLKKDGINADKEWYDSELEEKTANGCRDPDPKSWFINGYLYDKNKKAGVIVADTIFRKRNAALPWSEVVFQQYKNEVSDSILDDLKYIYQQTIVNDNTEKIIKEAIKTGEGEEISIEKEKWHVFRFGSTSFTALLGTENGRGTGYLVNDHLDELKRKRVSEIHVCLSEPENSSMKIVIDPVPEGGDSS